MESLDACFSTLLEREGERKAGWRGKETDTCSMQSAEAELYSERSNNSTEAAQLLRDHAGAEPRICPAPKAPVFSAAMGTLQGGQKNPPPKRGHVQTCFSCCTFPWWPSSVRKGEGTSFAWSAKEDLGSVVREELHFCFQGLEGPAPGRQEDLCLLPRNRDEGPRPQQEGLGKDRHELPTHQRTGAGWSAPGRPWE